MWGVVTPHSSRPRGPTIRAGEPAWVWAYVSGCGGTTVVDGAGFGEAGGRGREGGGWGGGGGGHHMKEGTGLLRSRTLMRRGREGVSGVEPACGLPVGPHVKEGNQRGSSSWRALLEVPV